MPYLATITSKRQLTVPIDLFKKLGFSKGDKLLLQEDKGGLLVRKSDLLVDQLAASVSVLKRFIRLSPDKAILIAKKRRFNKKK